jgi:predicted ATPase with chaperone activity
MRAGDRPSARGLAQSGEISLAYQAALFLDELPEFCEIM